MLVWADNFSMYGAASTPMLDGLYVELADISFHDDPDGVSSGKVLQLGSSGLNDAVARLVLPTAQPIVGIASRIWLPALPTANDQDVCPHVFRNVSNGNIVAIKVTNTGRIQARSTTSTGTLFGETSTPVVTANAWNHIETKVVRDAAAGTIEVRVNGVTRLSLSGLALGANDIAQVTPYTGEGSGGSERPYFTKDFVVWDGTGTQNNDFLGQVSVFWRKPIATLVAGGWQSNANADADDTVLKPRLANIFTASGAIISGNQVRINSTYYNWTSGSVDAGAPAGTSTNPWLVALGASDAESLANLYAAIGATGVAGTTYSTALTAHTTATPFGLTDTTIAVIPTDGVTTSMTFSETGTNTSWLSTTAFLDRVHDAIHMTAGFTPGPVYPTPFEVQLEELPEDVTSIRGVIPLVRAAKIDGGDGNIQVSFGISNASYDDGPDTPITTAYTYWGNPTVPFVSELNPLTAAPWTPGDFNTGARMKVSRTA